MTRGRNPSNLSSDFQNTTSVGAATQAFCLLLCCKPTCLIRFAYIADFVLCAAVALGAIWMARQAVVTYNSSFHKRYFYYLVSYYAFAFYGLWAPILSREVLIPAGVAAEHAAQLVRFLPFLAMPFALISWAMLGGLGKHLQQEGIGTWRFTGFVLLFGALIPSGLLLIGLWGNPGWMEGGRLMWLLVISYLTGDAAFSLRAFADTLRSRGSFPVAGRGLLGGFSALLLLAWVIRGLGLAGLLLGSWQAAAGLLLYFLSALLPFLYQFWFAERLFVPVYPQASGPDKLDRLVAQYGITAREREVIEKICEGKTNRQIADELFISLQTVKDHTHRIYNKVGVNSRLKLAQLLNN